jgi:hypothetical protein
VKGAIGAVGGSAAARTESTTSSITAECPLGAAPSAHRIGFPPAIATSDGTPTLSKPANSLVGTAQNDALAADGPTCETTATDRFQSLA